MTMLTACTDAMTSSVGYWKQQLSIEQQQSRSPGHIGAVLVPTELLRVAALVLLTAPSNGLSKQSVSVSASVVPWLSAVHVHGRH